MTVLATTIRSRRSSVKSGPTDRPVVVTALANREAMVTAAPHIIAFFSPTRVRVPAFRDSSELHLGHSVHT